MSWGTISPMLTSDSMLLGIGILLIVVVCIAWYMSNRAEATPNEDQLVEMRAFVNEHFAKYVARGLAAEGSGAVAISGDPAWRKVYLQHLRLHNELYAFRRDVALRVFDAEIDAAVRRQLAEVQAAGQTMNPAVAAV
jgi:hypothetical protein